MIPIQPLISEQSLKNANRGWYTFKTEVGYNKPVLARTISSYYKVTVVAIKTSTHKGKPKRTGKRRVEVAGKSWKKVFVKLKKDQKIDVFTTSSTETK